ncbi:hypothetical protein FNV43_RR19629 [Rhamnella rubrinervis]|uniref:DET1- and DDB1-associated protein 1 domain-containing protein n=1 Tax=Rhamnella rubrinervis TaxID=2594499 RepID=A0A8K0DY74_9ROSA|nr:hypothetical protein FNV43_RR19629 [Rhamnella rubrinervis]
MEGSSSQPSDSNQTSNGASKFLANLPSRGLFSSTVLSSNPGGMRVYVCVHDTSPPEGQQIMTNQQNILIRSLTLRNKKGDSGSKDVKGAGAAESSRKRAPERVLDSRASAKRTNNQSGSRQEGSNVQTPTRDYQGLTVERLRALLKAKGLFEDLFQLFRLLMLCLPCYVQDELIARLKGASGST